MVILYVSSLRPSCTPHLYYLALTISYPPPHTHFEILIFFSFSLLQSAVLPSNKWNHLVLSVDYQDPYKPISPRKKEKDQNALKEKDGLMNSEGKSENDAVIEEVSDIIPSSTSCDYPEDNEDTMTSHKSISDSPSNSNYVGNRKLVKIENTEVMRRNEFEKKRMMDVGRSDWSMEEKKESPKSVKEKEREKENEKEKEAKEVEPIIPGYSVRVALNGVPLSCREYCTFPVKGSKYVSEFTSGA